MNAGITYDGSGATSASLSYRPELDALRFFAFLGVFIFHATPRNADLYTAAGIPIWLGNAIVSLSGAGACGVDLFFALSGYLITAILLRERTTRGDINLRNFYIRRILRIWPLYLAFIGFAVTLSLIRGHGLPWHYVLGYCLFVGNWIQALYGLPAAVTAHLWTISIEEQFYIVWPLVVKSAVQRRLAVAAICVLVFASLSQVVLAAAGVSLVAFKENTFTRIDPIALGILLALFYDRIPILAYRCRLILLLSGFSGFAAVYTLTFSSPWRLTLGLPAAALSSTAVLVAVLGSQHPLLRNKAIVYLGKISYGSYVVHLFGLSCAGYLISTGGIVGVITRSALGLALTLLLASVSYRYLESPFLRLKARYSTSRPEGCR